MEAVPKTVPVTSTKPPDGMAVSRPAEEVAVTGEGPSLGHVTGSVIRATVRILTEIAAPPLRDTG